MKQSLNNVYLGYARGNNIPWHEAIEVDIATVCEYHVILLEMEHSKVLQEAEERRQKERNARIALKKAFGL